MGAGDENGFCEVRFGDGLGEDGAGDVVFEDGEDGDGDGLGEDGDGDVNAIGAGDEDDGGGDSFCEDGDGDVQCTLYMVLVKMEMVVVMEKEAMMLELVVQM